MKPTAIKTATAARAQAVGQTSTALVPTTEQTSAVSVVVDYGEDAGKGFENQTRDDIQIPFLNLLQPMSPLLQERQEAKAGQLYNTVTEELVDGVKGVVFIPATTSHTYVEYKPRVGGSGGGFVAVHKLNSDVVKAAIASAESFGNYKLPNKNELVETFSVYGLIVNPDGATGFAVLGFTSTKIAPYKRWSTVVNMFTLPGPTPGSKVRPPLFAHQVRITSYMDKNDKGIFYNYKLTPAINGSVKDSLLPPGSPLLLEAKNLRELVDGGLAKADYGSQQPAAEGTGGAQPDWNK